MPLRDPDDRKPFAAMLKVCADALRQRELSKDVLRTYWAALRMYDLEAIRHALDAHVRNPDGGQFMPVPADIVRMIDGGAVDGAMRAWATVERAIRSIGGYEDVVFDDAIVHRAIDDLGGWIKLCATTEKELPFTANKFCALYRGYAMRREVVRYPGVLVGRINGERALTRVELLPPVLVGHREACDRVRLGGAESTTPSVTRAAQVLQLEGANP